MYRIYFPVLRPPTSTFMHVLFSYHFQVVQSRLPYLIIATTILFDVETFKILVVTKYTNCSNILTNLQMLLFYIHSCKHSKANNIIGTQTAHLTHFTNPMIIPCSSNTKCVVFCRAVAVINAPMLLASSFLSKCANSICSVLSTSQHSFP